MEEIGDALHSQHTAAAQSSVKNFVATRECTGMRTGCLCRSRGSSGFDYDNWFAQGHLASGGEERARVANRLHIQKDAFGGRIIAEEINEVSPPNIQHGAS